MPPSPRKAPARKTGPVAVEDFVYTAPNGKTIALPPMHKALNAGELRRLRKSSQLEIVFYVIERDNPAEDDGSTPVLDALDEALDSMSIETDIPELIEQWQDYSKTTLGESSAS